MKKLFIKHPTIYLVLIVLIGIALIFYNIQIFGIYCLIIYLIDSNIKISLIKKMINLFQLNNEIKLFAIAKKVKVNENDLNRECKSQFTSKEKTEQLEKDLETILDRIEK